MMTAASAARTARAWAEHEDGVAWNKKYLYWTGLHGPLDRATGKVSMQVSCGHKCAMVAWNEKYL